MTPEKRLKALIKAIEQHVREMDSLMKKPPSFDRGRGIASLLGELENAKNTAKKTQD